MASVEEMHSPQEEDWISARGIGLVAVISVIVVVISVWVAWAMLPDGPLGPPPRAMPAERYGFDPAPIETFWRAELFYERGRNRLETYGFVDEERRIVHVPIQRAMERYLETGERR